MTLLTKQCTGRCGRELPLDAENFHRHARSRDGFRARCRECVAADCRDEALVKRLGLRRADVASIAEAHRKGVEEGVAAAWRYLRAKGRLLPSDDEAAAQRRAERIAAKADLFLADDDGA
jgi:hypothetical protein